MMPREAPSLPAGVDDLDDGHEDLMEDLADICRAVTIESGHAFQFAGRRFDVQGPGPAPLIRCLQQVLYDEAYTRPLDDEHTAESPAPDSMTDAAFAAALVSVVTGDGRFPGPPGFLDTGWRLVSWLGNGGVVATKNGFQRVFHAGTYGPVSRMPLGIGSPLVVWWSRTSPWEQPGFFYVFSQTVPESWEPGSLVRLYWNLRAEEAPQRITDLVERLDRFQVPYQLKTLSDPSCYRLRCDGTVLYFQRRHFAIVSRLALAASTAPGTEAEVPLFTRRLGPGLGVAEDPGTSFGMSRCGVLSEALWNAWYLGRGDSVDGMMEEIIEHFTRCGIDLERPYLNAMSAAVYAPPCLEEGP